MRRRLITYVYLLTAHGANILMEVEEAGGGRWWQAEEASGSCANPPAGATVAATRVPLDSAEIDRTYTNNIVVLT